jgi:parallel beta-helix repeat protein
MRGQKIIHVVVIPIMVLSFAMVSQGNDNDSKDLYDQVQALQAAAAAPIMVKRVHTCKTKPFVANKPGTLYIVVNDLMAKSTSGDCIDVTAPGVTVDLNGHTLTGNGTGAGAGINIMAQGTGAHITSSLPGGTITAFGTGVRDLASSALIENLVVSGNLAAGIHLSSVDGSAVDANFVNNNLRYGIYLEDTTNCVVQHNAQVSFNGNGTVGYGIWVQNSGNNLIIANELNKNFLAGIWVGFRDRGVRGSCPWTPSPSVDNVIANNGPINTNGQVGIGLECGSANRNSVFNNTASGNSMFDGYDGNPSCDSNLWGLDHFAVVNNPACVH